MRALFNVSSSNTEEQIVTLLTKWGFHCEKRTIVEKNTNSKNNVEKILSDFPQEHRKQLEDKWTYYFVHAQQTSPSSYGIIIDKEAETLAFRLVNHDTRRLRQSLNQIVNCLTNGIQKHKFYYFKGDDKKFFIKDFKGKKFGGYHISDELKITSEIEIREGQSERKTVVGTIKKKGIRHLIKDSLTARVLYCIALMSVIILSVISYTWTHNYPYLLITEVADKLSGSYKAFPFLPKITGYQIVFWSGFIDRLVSGLVFALFIATFEFFIQWRKLIRSAPITWDLTS